MSSTVDQSGAGPKLAAHASPEPGLILVFSGRQPFFSVLPLRNDELELGRDSLAAQVTDGRISRSHARVTYKHGRFSAVDLGSRNGTAVDGRMLTVGVEQPIERCLRIGDTLFLPTANVHALDHSGLIVRSGRVLGPRLLSTYLGISRLAATSTMLLITGESGVGKEDAARAFHTATAKPNGPFVGVNCATIPESIAERLLFGARRGAFSGVTSDAEGYIQAAHGGTLFLDEIAELDVSVQAKLLRVLESREVHALGAIRPTPVDIRVCSASHMDLRSQVALGRLREDLYYRIGRPEVVIPPLRERPEEIPWLIALELGKVAPDLPLHHSFVEACLVRVWPGNIRELLVEVRAAVQEAISQTSPRLTAQHLSATAGQNIRKQAPGLHSPPSVGEPSSAVAVPLPTAVRSADSLPTEQRVLPTKLAKDVDRDAIQEALRRTGGNVSKASRLLGLHRNALRRLIEHHAIDLSRIVDPL